MHYLFYDVENKLSSVLFEMEEAGFKIDEAVLDELKKKYESELAELTLKIYKLAGEQFNINSPKQVAEVLFDKMQIKPKKKGKSGNYSTNAKILDELALDYEIARNILEHRQLMKLKTTYIDGIKQYPEKPEITEEIVNGDIITTATYNIVYIPTQKGKITIPSVKIEWFNVKNNKFP